jgi:hypothetical protein
MKVFTISERRMLIELLSKEQINMVIVDCTQYNSDKYKALEALKVKIKDM